MVYYHCPSISDVNTIANARAYKNRDEITISPDKMGAVYEEKVRTFFNEHLHEDEEIRYILDGEGYFDIRSLQDEWVRIRMEKNDLIILPAGIFHRFTTNTKNVGYQQHRDLCREKMLKLRSTSKLCGFSRNNQSGHR